MRDLVASTTFLTTVSYHIVASSLRHRMPSSASPTSVFASLGGLTTIVLSIFFLQVSGLYIYWPYLLPFSFNYAETSLILHLNTWGLQFSLLFSFPQNLALMVLLSNVPLRFLPFLSLSIFLIVYVPLFSQFPYTLFCFQLLNLSSLALILFSLCFTYPFSLFSSPSCFLCLFFLFPISLSFFLSFTHPLSL